MAIVENAGSRSKAGLAAYTLGRLYLDQLSMPKEAAASLERARLFGIPDALRDAAMANLLKALRMQRDARWVALVEAYLDRYPTGR